MSGHERAVKRHKPDPAPTAGSPLLNLGNRVFQVASRSQQPKPLAVTNGNLYDAVNAPGALIVDNSADLGRFMDGGLLRAETSFYLGFATSSDYSARQVASFLEMYHDKAAKHRAAFFNNFEMVQYAAGAKPSTHARLRLDFSPSGDSYFKGASETLPAVEAFINRIVKATVKHFVREYSSLLPNDGLGPEEPSESPLSSFIERFATRSKTPLFVTVHDLHRLLERPFDAAYWARYKPTSINDRLGIVQRLLLGPIWKHLGGGAVRKFLIVGQYLPHAMVHPRDLSAFPGLPTFANLSSRSALHGFSPTQIRLVYSLPVTTLAHKKFLYALSCCNFVVLRDNHGGVIFTKESVESVFRRLCGDLSLLETDDYVQSVCTSYVEAEHDAAARALYPLLLQYPEFRDAVEKALINEGSLDTSLDPVFDIDDLVNAAPTGVKLFARVFMLGLMGRVERTHGDQTLVHYTIAGGCARTLLEKLLDETEPETYTKKYRQRPPTKGYSGINPLPGLEDYLDVGDFDVCNPTEESLAKLILEFFRPIRRAKYIRAGERAFQEIMLQLLRAALIKKFGPTVFFNVLQLEMWLRLLFLHPKRDRHKKVSVKRRWRPKDFCADIVHHVITPDGQHMIIIYELKWFNLGDTMERTHLHLRALQGDDEGSATRLNSQLERVGEKEDKEKWYKAADTFLKEMSSMPFYPPNWFPDPLASKVDMPFPLQVQHLCADVTHYLGGDLKGSGMTTTTVKWAVPVAAGCVTQAGQYRDIAALGIADELAAIDEPVDEPEPTRGEEAVGRDTGAVVDDGPKTAGADVHDKTTDAKLDRHPSDNLQGWADKRITDMGPGTTVIKAFAITCVAGAVVFVKELEETKTLNREIAIVDAYSWRNPEDVGKKAADKVYLAKQQYQRAAEAESRRAEAAKSQK
ncbi:hypothetical protein AURDEDRAFT_186386 [Auricularia subglabra TFB-10046 SS5]|nr:hypothetical protein AURDEDRAFT_186386 [Auricularia subglabra TFB-10046 SS5]